MEFIKSFSATMMTNKQTNNNNKNRTKIKSMMETVIIINERYVLIVENKTKKKLKVRKKLISGTKATLMNFRTRSLTSP